MANHSQHKRSNIQLERKRLAHDRLVPLAVPGLRPRQYRAPVGSDLSVAHPPLPLKSAPNLTQTPQDFSKTVFTPAGVDIYWRQPLVGTGREGQIRLKGIVDGIIASSDQTVSRLASERGFTVGEA